MITLWNLFEASILVLNAICILHEERFLSKVGWLSRTNQDFGEYPSVKSNIANLIKSIRTVVRRISNRVGILDVKTKRCKVQVPLILFNTLTIVKKLLVG